MVDAQLKLASGEPRFTKIKGESRYYDHKLGKSVSHRQYWNVRKAAAGKLSTAPAARSSSPFTKPSSPAPIPLQTAPAAGPSLLAQELLQAGMLGSPAVETPPAPSTVASDLATAIAEDTKKSVESLAEVFAPVITSILILAGSIFTPEHWRWLIPEQEEGELMIEPAARLVLRYFGITGKQLGPNGSDMLSLLVAIAAYGMGARQRMDDYLAALDEEEESAAPSVPARRGAGAGANAGANSSRGASTSTHANDGSASSPAYTAVFGRNTEQSSPAASYQNGATAPRMGVQPNTQRQAEEASRVRALLDADYQGRLRLGLN